MATTIGRLSIAMVSSTTVLTALPVDNELLKVIISGATSLISLGVVELFKYLKTRRRIRRIRKSYVSPKL